MPHIDTVSYIRPVTVRDDEAVPFEMKTLQHMAATWINDFRDIAARDGMTVTNRTCEWQAGPALQELLPTDIVSYVVDVVKPDIAVEIGTLLLEGRVHLIQILSKRELPHDAGWFQTLRELPLQCKEVRGILVVSPEEMQLHSARSLILTQDMLHYSRNAVMKAVDQVRKIKTEKDDW